MDPPIHDDLNTASRNQDYSMINYLGPFSRALYFVTFKCDVKKGKITCKQADDLQWINLNEISDYAFPKANHKLFAILGP